MARARAATTRNRRSPGRAHARRPGRGGSLSGAGVACSDAGAGGHGARYPRAHPAPVTTGPAAPPIFAPAGPLVLAPSVASVGPARVTGEVPRDRAGAAAASSAAVRALVAAGASAGLLPFAARADAAAGGAHRASGPSFDPAVAARVRAAVAAADGRPTTARHPAPGQAHHGGGGSTPPAPPSPIGPPGNAGAGGVAGAAGGAASAVWCALLAGTLVLLLQELRRHRFRLVVPAPRGVAFSLQRPG